MLAAPHMSIKSNIKRRSMRQFCLAHGHVYSYRRAGDYVLHVCSYASKHGVLKYKLKPNYQKLITLKRMFDDDHQRFRYPAKPQFPV